MCCSALCCFCVTETNKTSQRPHARAMLGNNLLWVLYKEGPAYMGGWLGLSDPEICARLAPGSQVLDWARADDSHCQALIARSFRGFALSVHAALGLLAVYCLLWTMWHLPFRAMCAALCRHRGGSADLLPPPSASAPATLYVLALARPCVVAHEWDEGLQVRRKRGDGQAAHKLDEIIQGVVDDVNFGHGPIGDVQCGDHAPHEH